jgi:hypothetical protein
MGLANIAIVAPKQVKLKSVLIAPGAVPGVKKILF